MTYSVRIIAGGKIVGPAAVPREPGLNDGDVVQIEREGDHVVLKSRTQVLREFQARFRATIKVPCTVNEFLAGQAAEAARDDLQHRPVTAAFGAATHYTVCASPA